MKIEVRIDRLVVDPGSASGRYAERLRRELARTLAQRFAAPAAPQPLAAGDAASRFVTAGDAASRFVTAGDAATRAAGAGDAPSVAVQHGTPRTARGSALPAGLAAPVAAAVQSTLQAALARRGGRR